MKQTSTTPEILNTTENELSIIHHQLSVLESYFPGLTEIQREQLKALYPLYADWNAKINVISRKDIVNLYEHHVLHSLGIAKVLNFQAGTSVLDLGTGGGFPGIPLAILFPEVRFHLIDSIGKKIKVGQAVAEGIGLKNITFRHCRGEEEKQTFDFVVSRAVMPLSDLVKIISKNIKKEQQSALPNGLICLKGGELQHEILPFRNKAMSVDLQDYFKEDFFETKKVYTYHYDPYKTF
ncbi:MAG: 16S rRNA (guanine(527)-N(7))-methyltransferase RsmG [Tannerellaceae bacterium]|nr:16S rRNA (guanine(527)-N(7))-methyltransferase RsmG [Tannerellaceae bacterium]